MSADGEVKLGVKLDKKGSGDETNRSPKVTFYMSDGGLNEDNYRDILMYEIENNPDSMGNRMMLDEQYRFMKENGDCDEKEVCGKYVTPDLEGHGRSGKEINGDVYEEEELKDSSFPSRHRIVRFVTHFLRSPLMDHLGMVLSGIYGIMLVLLGVAINIARIYTSNHSHLIFSIYLYTTSIIFLLLLMVCPVQMSALRKRFQDLLSKKIIFNRRKTTMDEPGRNSNLLTFSAGSFYLRLSAMGFGIGSMIMIGLGIGEFIEKYKTRGDNSVLSEGLTSSLHLIFTFIQLYFIFTYSKVSFQKRKFLTRFGTSHLGATNICVWLSETVTSTWCQTRVANTTFPATGNSSTPSEAVSNLGDITTSIIPYLYPFIIQYSYISTGILCVIWYNIGKTKTTRKVIKSGALTQGSKNHPGCSGSSRGLFFGVIIIVLTVIISKIFIVLLEGDFISRNNAFKTQYISEITVSLLLSFAAILAFWNWRKLSFNIHKTSDLEEILLVLSLVGVYSFNLFSIVAVNHVENESSQIVGGASFVFILECTLQYVLIVCGLRMCVKRSDSYLLPGREVIIFLLVSNLAIFGIDVAVVQNEETNPIQIEFYGYETWYLIVHLTWPFVLSYRALTVICLSKIWKLNLTKRLPASHSELSSSES